MIYRNLGNTGLKVQDEHIQHLQMHVSQFVLNRLCCRHHSTSSQDCTPILWEQNQPVLVPC